VLAVSAVVSLATVSACGDQTRDVAGGRKSTSSSSSSPSATGSKSGAGDLGAAADGECGGGEFATKVVKAARGVQLTVPADWRVQVARQGSDVRLLGPDEGALEGQMVIQDKDQSMAQAVKDLEKANSMSERTAERDLRLSGFEASKLLVFAGKDYTNINVVAIAEDGLRTIAYVIVEDAPEQESMVASCLSTLSHPS
jgi:hypothetical protein